MRNVKEIQQYEYDYSVDGGAAGTFELSAKKGKMPIPVGAIVTQVYAKVVSAVTADGSAVLEWGAFDTDGYSGTAIAVASFTDNVVFFPLKTAALLRDDTNKVDIGYAVTSAATGAFNFKVTSANLTAGKILFFVEFIHPTED